MNKKDEFKHLIPIAKKVLDKKKFSKINKLKDLTDKKRLFEHMIKRELELKIMDFRKEVKKLKGKKKDVFFISIKINLLKSKISYFTINFEKKNFGKINKLIKEIKRDLKNA